MIPSDYERFEAEIRAAKARWLARSEQNRQELVDECIDIAERYFGNGPEWPVIHSQYLDAADTD